MKQYKRVLLASAVALALGSGSAQADPATFILPGPVQFKYNNLEVNVSAVGQVLNGIFNVSTVNDIGGNPFWAARISDGTQLTGRFDALTVAEILNPAPGSFIIYFTGGTLSIYNVPGGATSLTGSFRPTSPANPIEPQICAASPGSVCPTAWLTANFFPGTAIDIVGTPFDESTATLVSTITGTLATPTGSGDGLLDFTGGTAFSKFKTGPGADASIQSQLQSCPGTGQFALNCGFNGNTWPIASTDPMIGTAVAVPEPTTLALLGLGLAGIGFGASRRKKEAAAA